MVIGLRFWTDEEKDNAINDTPSMNSLVMKEPEVYQRIRAVKPKPYVISAGPSCFCDIDDTLICWNIPENVVPEDSIDITCKGVTSTFYINEHNLELVNKLGRRGCNIVFWSAGGVEWCEAVVKALKLEHLASAILSKPTYYLDDIKDANEWIGKHRFYDFDGNIGYDYKSEAK